MRNLRGAIAAVAAGLGTAAVGGWLAVGCGSNNNTPLPTVDAGPDATSDARSDVGLDARPDSQPDALDAGADTSDAPEAATVDAADAALTPLAFANSEAVALCDAYLNCCPGGLDSGIYDLASCITNLQAYGWEGTLPSNETVYKRSAITVDQAKAQACLAAIKTFPCGTQTAAQWATITHACELVLTGTIPANQAGCVSSWECAPGTFCNPSVDGGLCTPLATQGQPCDTVINSLSNPLPDEMCSYLGSAQPALFCDLITKAADAATCQPLLTNGTRCANAGLTYLDDQACPTTAPLCGDSLTCGGSASAPYGLCKVYTISDAGGGG